MRRLAALLLALVLVPAVPVPALAADHPAAYITSPSNNASVPLNTPLVVAGGAVNGETGGITGADISTDGVNWTSADEQGETWSITLTPSVPGPLTIHARGRTASTIGDVITTRTIHVGGTTQPPINQVNTLILPYLAFTPVIKDADTDAVELGLRTRFDRPGTVTAVDFRRGNYTGPVTARLWQDGTLLAEQPGSASTAFLQRIEFTTPVPVVPGTDYVVSYYTPAGGYVSSEAYFTGGIAQAPFYLPPDAGVYLYGEGGGFPTNSWNASNYWVEPVFRP